MGLQPQQLHWHTKQFNAERLEDYRLFDCIECGCCSYVCPSHIPLVDNYRQAKTQIWNNRRKRLEAEQNRQRYLNKMARMELQAQEKNKIHAGNINEQAHNDDALKMKKDEIAAAVERVKAKRQLKEK